jgi:hypothetical protein
MWYVKLFCLVPKYQCSSKLSYLWTKPQGVKSSPAEEPESARVCNCLVQCDILQARSVLGLFVYMTHWQDRFCLGWEIFIDSKVTGAYYGS